MKQLLVLGAGTAGTMVVDRLRRVLDVDEWKITIVDPSRPTTISRGSCSSPLACTARTTW